MFFPGISSDVDRIEEPSSGRGTPVTFTVTRRFGLRGLVELEWIVEIAPANSAAPGGNNNSTQSLNNGDVDVEGGSLYFVTNETTETFVIKASASYNLHVLGWKDNFIPAKKPNFGLPSFFLRFE